MKNYLLCYDVTDAKRLYKVRKTLYPHALGGQKSALEAPLSKKEVKKLLCKLSHLINIKQDKINFIEVQSNPQLLGKSLDITYEEGMIIL